jgi:FAD/FMN-containing dehydrogenase
VSAAEIVRPSTTLAEDFPDFDGVLLLDDASRTATADDFGHIIHRQPLAVLKPGSVDDVVKLVQFARRNKINVAARGQGHSTQGQAQVEAGVVVDIFLSDLEKLIDDGRFDTVQGFAVPDGAGGCLYQMETAKYFSPGNEPDDAAFLSGLAFNPGTQTAQDMTYFDYLNRLAPSSRFYA